MKEPNVTSTVLFQIEFIAKNVVRLYLNGNDIRTSLGGIKRTLLNVSQTSTEEDFAEYEAGGNDYLNGTDLNETSEHITVSHDCNKTENNDKDTNDGDINNLNLESEKTSVNNDYSEKSLLDTADAQFYENGNNEMDGSKSSKSAKKDLAQDDPLLEAEDSMEKSDKIASPKKSDSENNAIDAGNKNGDSQSCDIGDNKIDDSENDKSAADLAQEVHLVEGGEDVEKKYQIEENKVDGSNSDKSAADLAQELHLVEGGDVKKKDKVASPTKSESDSQSCDVGDNEMDRSNSDKPIADLAQDDSLVEVGDVEKNDKIASPTKSESHSESWDVRDNKVDGSKGDTSAVDLAQDESLVENGEDVEKKDKIAYSTKSESDSQPCNVGDNKMDGSKGDKSAADLVQDDHLAEGGEDEAKKDKIATPTKNGSEINVVDDRNKNVHVTSVLHEETEKVSPKKDTLDNVIKDIDKDLDEVPEPLEIEKTPLSSEKCAVDINTDVKVAPLLDDTIQKPLDGKDVRPAPKKDESEESSNEKHVDLTSLLYEEIEKALDKKDMATSRPSSSCSGKIKHDDRILPASISRPHTPLNSTDEYSENMAKGLTDPEAISVVKDLPDDNCDKHDDFETKSRPQSAGSGKISHDDRIVPAVLSRPQSPLPVSDNNESQKTGKAN